MQFIFKADEAGLWESQNPAKVHSHRRKRVLLVTGRCSCLLYSILVIKGKSMGSTKESLHEETSFLFKDYLAALCLSCGTWDLSFQGMTSLVVAQGL